MNVGCANTQHELYSSIKGIPQPIVTDYKHFYSPGNLAALTAGLGTAGMMANTQADHEIQDWYRESVRSGSTDNMASLVKSFGNGRITIPVLAGTALLGELTESGSMPGEWARRSLRTMLVGVPPLLFFQRSIGASRPNEGDSYWHPFEDDNGVSGHSFMGSVPFLTAAKMTENSWLKALFYLTSTFCGLSRINDDKHYASQAILGWWMANLAASSVNKTELQKNKKTLIPIVSYNGVGIALNVQF